MTWFLEPKESLFLRKMTKYDDSSRYLLLTSSTYLTEYNPRSWKNIVSVWCALLHYDIKIRTFLYNTILNRGISWRGAVEWPRSPYLTHINVFLWVSFKSKVYSKRLQYLDTLNILNIWNVGDLKILGEINSSYKVAYH